MLELEEEPTAGFIEDPIDEKPPLGLGVGELECGRELLNPSMENGELLTGTDFRGIFWAARPWPIADPTRSPKRLGFLSGMPTREEELTAGLAEDQLRPCMSPTMEGEGFGRPDRAAVVGWCVQEGFAAGEVFRDDADEDEGGFDDEEAFGLSFWSLRGRADEELPEPIPKSNLYESKEMEGEEEDDGARWDPDPENEFITPASEVTTSYKRKRKSEEIGRAHV